MSLGAGQIDVLRQMMEQNLIISMETGDRFRPGHFLMGASPMTIPGWPLHRSPRSAGWPESDKLQELAPEAAGRAHTQRKYRCLFLDVQPAGRRAADPAQGQRSQSAPCNRGPMPPGRNARALQANHRNPPS